MNDGLEKYVPRKYKIPTFEEVLTELGIADEDKYLFTEKVVTLIRKRTLLWLNRAASYAYATLNMASNAYPGNNEQVERILKELSEVFENMADVKDITTTVIPQPFGVKIEIALAAVSHAGNWFNNTAMVLPKEYRKAVLDARDICDEAIRQPGV